MIKKAHLVLLLLSVSFFSFSQNNQHEEAMNLVAKDLCEELDGFSFEEGATLNQKQVKLGLLMISSYNKVKKSNKYLQKNKVKDFEAFGEELGVKLVEFCPSTFMALFTEDGLEDLIDEEDNGEPLGETISIELSDITLHNDIVSIIKGKDQFNKTHSFIIMDKFIGIELLEKKNLAKDFKFYFNEKYFFDLSEKRKIKKKVLNKIELL